MLELLTYILTALLIAIVFCEGAVLLLIKRRYAALGLCALATVCLLFALWVWSEAPWQWRVSPERDVAPYLLGLWLVAVPVAALSASSFALARLRRPLWRHMGALVVSVAAVSFYPFFALYSVCATGLDCL